MDMSRYPDRYADSFSFAVHNHRSELIKSLSTLLDQTVLHHSSNMSLLSLTLEPHTKDLTSGDPSITSHALSLMSTVVGWLDCGDLVQPHQHLYIGQASGGYPTVDYTLTVHLGLWPEHYAHRAFTQVHVKVASWRYLHHLAEDPLADDFIGEMARTIDRLASERDYMTPVPDVDEQPSIGQRFFTALSDAVAAKRQPAE